MTSRSSMLFPQRDTFRVVVVSLCLTVPFRVISFTFVIPHEQRSLVDILVNDIQHISAFQADNHGSVLILCITEDAIHRGSVDESKT